MDGKGSRTGAEQGGRVITILAPLAVLVLSACAGAQPASYAAVTCRDSLPTSETGPYRPGVVCLSHGESPTMGARSGPGDASAMKAISVDGRVFFVDARRNTPPEALLHR